MKRYSMLIVAAAAVVAVAVVWNSASGQQSKPASPSRVAVCDVLVVFKDYQRAKDLSKKLKDRLGATQAEADKRAKAIDKLNMALEELKVDSKEYDDRLNEVMDLTAQRQVWLTVEEQKAKLEKYRLTKDMYEEILKTVETVAKEHGYDLVLIREPSDEQSRDIDELLQQMARRKVLYSSSSLDLTEDVLQRLNENYKAKGK